MDSYPFFVVGILHVISSAVLGFGGIYHAVLGPEYYTTPFNAIRWQDKNEMTSILGIHLVVLGIGALLLVYKAVSLGSNVRRVSHSTLRPATILAYWAIWYHPHLVVTVGLSVWITWKMLSVDTS